MKLCMYGNDDIFSHQIQVKPTHEDRNNRLIHNEILISFNNRNSLIVELYFILIFLQE